MEINKNKYWKSWQNFLCYYKGIIIKTKHKTNKKYVSFVYLLGINKLCKKRIKSLLVLTLNLIIVYVNRCTCKSFIKTAFNEYLTFYANIISVWVLYRRNKKKKERKTVRVKQIY